MPTVTVNGVELNYIDTETGGQPIVFAHGFLMSHALFAPQIEALQGRFRCVAYDHRGQAGSGVPETGYDMESVAEDGAALIEALELGPCHFVGLSMGGFVGMRLAARRPELIRSLVLMDTSADPEPHAFKYRALGLLAKWFGLGVVADRAMRILFGETFMDDPDRAEIRETWRQHIVEGHDRDGVLRALEGLSTRRSVFEELGGITAPTLVMTGEEDVATTPHKGRRIAAAIPGAQYLDIPRAGHSAPLENPEWVSRALKAFFDGQ